MEKKKFSLFAWMQKIPGGIILVPLFIGIFMNTFFPRHFRSAASPPACSRQAPAACWACS